MPLRFNAWNPGNSQISPNVPQNQGQNPLWRTNDQIFGNYSPQNQTSVNPMMNNQMMSNPPTNMNLWQNYQQDARSGREDYDQLMNLFTGYKPTDIGSFEEISAPTVDPNILRRFETFADTGGFSPQDIREMRARGVSPIRAVYGNAQRNVNRQRALQGGYSPNYAAATAKMSRGLAGQIADATTNVNAEIARMRQQGKLAGLSGLSDISKFYGGEEGATSRANLQGRLTHQQQQQAAHQSLLDAYRSAASLYGTSPGRESLSANVMQKGIDQGMQRSRDVFDAALEASKLGPTIQQGYSNGGGFNMLGNYYGNQNRFGWGR